MLLDTLISFVSLVDKFKNINTRLYTLILPLFLVSQLGKKLNRILPIPGVYRKTVILCRERALSTKTKECIFRPSFKLSINRLLTLSR